ncbi:MAG: hypothetical protein V3U60_11345 [Gammaproteobacteria bacterium]
MSFLFLGSSHPGIILSPSSANVVGSKTGATAYAGIQFNASGEEFKTDSDGNSAYDVSRGLYIDSGDPDNVWIQWTRTGGTLGDWNSDDAGDARVQLSSSRSWRILRAGLGTDTIIGDFDFYDAVTGGGLLASVSLTFTATWDV